jgi:hypothetical protein
MEFTMRNTLLTIALISASLSSSVLADSHISGETSTVASPNWNYIQGSYASADVIGFEPSGFAVNGSHLIGDNFFLMGDYNLLSEDVSGFDLDVDYAQLSLGLGYRYAVNSSSDVYVAVSYEDVTFELSGNDSKLKSSENGYGVQVGVRSMVTDNIELSGSLGMVSIDSESDTAYDLGANYFFNESFSAGVGYSSWDDIDITSLNVRYSF